MWAVDASVLFALGRQHALDLLDVLDDVAVPPRVRDEVTQEPEATNLASFVATASVDTDARPDAAVEQARAILGDDHVTGDAAVIASVLAATDASVSVGVVSDDRRLRTIADGLGAAVTGTIGVIVEAVRHDRLEAAAAKQLVRDMDRRGFHTTGALRDTADELIDRAADETRQ